MSERKRIIRVFPRKTNATPDDEWVRFGPPSMFDEADEVHISVVFTWDIPYAEWLVEQWRGVAPVKMGGPALEDRGGDFEPGMYLKRGYTITSRGCPNRCWFCNVWKNEGGIREIPICDGWNIVDSNLLACSEKHIREVFEMLNGQRGVLFSGGLEAARLREWHVELLGKIRLRQAFFAYDTPNDLEPLQRAGAMLLNAGISQSKLYAYVLIGYPKDTFASAERRLCETWAAGFMPFAMLYRDEGGKYDKSWRRFQRQYARPAITRSLLTVGGPISGGGE